MADILPRLVVLKGRRRVLRRYGVPNGGTFDYLTDAQISQDGRQLLFSNGVANRGPGPLEVIGDASRERSRNGRRSMPAYQRVLQTDGSKRQVYIGRLVYDPDPDHDHWHFSGFAEYRLLNARAHRVRRSRKQAFCMMDFDQLQPGSARKYRRCPASARGISPEMGISPGWADTYTFDLHGQYINLSGIPSGVYWLESIANPSERLMLHRGKTRARVRLRIDKAARSVKVLR